MHVELLFSLTSGVANVRGHEKIRQTVPMPKAHDVKFISKNNNNSKRLPLSSNFLTQKSVRPFYPF